MRKKPYTERLKQFDSILKWKLSKVLWSNIYELPRIAYGHIGICGDKIDISIKK